MVSEKWRILEHIYSYLISFTKTNCHFPLILSQFILYMGPLFLYILTSALCCVVVLGSSSSEFIYPNFTATNLQFVDNSGAFLTSRNQTFKAAIINPGTQQTNFYLCVIHAISNTIIWSANRDAPISNSGRMSLTATGIYITDDKGDSKWSTPVLQSSVSSLFLSELGNLILLDQFNQSLWESFQNPTDTIVIGQNLPVGKLLYSAISSTDFSTGNYSFEVISDDAILQWNDLTYWKLSMEPVAITNSNSPAEFMAINRTGLYLFGQNGSVVVIQVGLSTSNFRIAKLDHLGQFTVSSFSGSDWTKDFVGPAEQCQVPYVCGRIGLCTPGSGSSTPVCSCPSNFQLDQQSNCVPGDSSYSLPVACTTTNNSSQLNSSMLLYMMLNYGSDYFYNDFSSPAKYGVNLSACEDLCSMDCSCLGIFYANSTGSCYVLQDELGSIMSTTTNENDQLGYIKALLSSSPKSVNDSSNNQTQRFPIVALVFLPFTGFVLVVALGFLCWRRTKVSKIGEGKLGHPNSSSSGDLEAFSIPGLPVRFDYEELEVATDNFKNLIGAGGFGAVYKGILHDKTLVAVKKITNLGLQGKKDFCTEIAIIGNIHHVNLVKLKGFCAQGRQRLLVYEYMNRGSLDQSLFGNGPVLEWQERVDIALGTARGLAYLHSGCVQKIIHCDVKPENILLHDHFQAKISDFGLSKLLSPEQSSLFTTMRGTRGYLAPEWLTSSAISEKTDVYSYGMVLLEIVSGRKNCMTRSLSQSFGDDNSNGAHSSSSSGSGLVYFPLLALEMHEQKRYLELADPRLEGRVTSEEVEKLVRVALCCVHEEPMLRPNMVSVVGMLEGRITLGHPRMESLNFLRFYGRRFAEASTIEEVNGESNVILFPQANASLASTASGSPTSFSYISSQQISGPR
ncbi:S-locus glycoprotein domain [Dillenia turbinata]|uniref:Receptor-like serine/threonine-protein kinase n=1 Tax=Dillenia turbinata TaxID=194707 RepID=A0AAN8VZ55_9MAGN